MSRNIISQLSRQASSVVFSSFLGYLDMREVLITYYLQSSSLSQGWWLVAGVIFRSDSIATLLNTVDYNECECVLRSIIYLSLRNDCCNLFGFIVHRYERDVPSKCIAALGGFIPRRQAGIVSVMLWDCFS